MIIPTVFVKKGDSFLDRFGKVLSLSSRIHIDFMDGLFVINKSVILAEIPNLSGYSKEFEAHLMVKFPKQYIEQLAKKGFKRVIYHYESQVSELDVKYMAMFIRRHKMIPVLAINPETPVDVCFPLLKTISHFLLMGVNPGEEHQTFIGETITKVKLLREKSKTALIQVDGGITPTVARRLFGVGCSHINSGSYVSGAKDPIKAFEKLEEAFHE